MGDKRRTASGSCTFSQIRGIQTKAGTKREELGIGERVPPHPGKSVEETGGGGVKSLGEEQHLLMLDEKVGGGGKEEEIFPEQGVRSA